MRPSINLYQSDSTEPTDFLSSDKILIAYGAMAIIFMGVYGLSVWGNADLDAQLLAETQQKNQAEKKLVSIQTEFADASQILALAREVSLIEKERDLKKQIVSFLSDKTLSNTTGFSDYLVSLAEQSESGLWFEGITLKNGGQSIRFSGKTRAPEILFQTVKRLGLTPSFADKEFNTFSLSTLEKENFLSFSLETQTQQEAANDDASPE